MQLTQSEADRLIKMTKQFKSQEILDIQRGEKMTYALTAPADKSIPFHIDTHRGKRNRWKFTYNHRAKKAFILVRLDIDGTHKNPDGEKIIGDHIHIYKEGYHDRWAYPLSQFEEYEFMDTSQIGQIFKEFCDFCNAENPPAVQNMLL